MAILFLNFFPERSEIKPETMSENNAEATPSPAVEEPKPVENAESTEKSKTSEPVKAETIYEFTVKDIDGNDVSMEKYRDNVLIVVNVASNCGFTKKNYQELNELYSKYKDSGLRIAAFPCNQFMNQESACEVDIKEFAKKNNVEFDMYSKILVNGKFVCLFFT